MSAPHALTAGYIPLTDAALLHAAALEGFAAAEGVALTLVPEVSWANLRDRLALGLFDCAHMLAPLPVAVSIGIGQLRVPCLAPFVLSSGGNAITLAQALAERLDPAAGPAAAAEALAAEAAARARRGAAPLVLATVFPFSNHTYELHAWLALGGLVPDRDLQLVTIPPPLMVEALARGRIDGFCAGAPWPDLAERRGLGRAVATSRTLWPGRPEKVLAVTAETAQRRPEALAALLRALDRAALWAEVRENRAALAGLLARAPGLDLPPALLHAGLEAEPAEMRFDLRRPSPEEGAWIIARMREAGQWNGDDAAAAEAGRVFRPDLYDDALAGR